MQKTDVFSKRKATNLIGGFATSFVVIAASFGNAAAVCGPGACDDSATWSTYSISVQVGKCLNGTVCGYRCQQNYYGTGSACSKCPSYLSIEGITSGPGTTDITSCYISKDATITDVTGQYTVFAQDCYYTESSTTPNPPSWSRHEIQEKLLEILNENLDANIPEVEFTYETRWIDIWISTGADSLDVFEFMMAIEEEFGIEVREEDLQNMQTVLDTIAYIEKELG